MGEKFYIAVTPDGRRRQFDTWDDCRAFRDSVPGTRVQGVDSREKVKEMLAGGVLLKPGTYAFTDGNALGGVGIVVLACDGEGVHVHHEVATNVFEVFAEGTVRGLESHAEIATALAALHNILAELAGFYGALALIPPGSLLTYKGVGAWMDGSWKTRDTITTSVVAACKTLVAQWQLNVTYLHQRGHQKSWAGRDDYARWNGRADQLATEGGKAS